ncbi:hypothetical protein [Actinophytocola glycyrrhizae]|uniref:Uncharacterized protein n=1 Tax=Actinophytocola glycyrrhizae TaxID=2044873 RepID=A0ABV9S397_9PSEU
MTQPAPGYRPYQQPMAPMMGAPTPPKQSRGGVTTLLAGVLALVVAGLAVGGSFGAISTYRNALEIGDETSVYASTTTWWEYNDDGSSVSTESESTLTGLTLVLAAALLVLGAVFAFVAARARTSGPVTATRSLISAGVGALASVALLQLFWVLNQTQRYNERELEAGETLEFTPGLGLWLPLGGLLLGVVAVALAHLGRRQGDVRMEPNTPRMGFPAPYGYRPPHMPVAERPTDVQISAEDAAADTQRVSGATASGEVSSAPAGEAQTPAAASAPLTPATTSAPGTGAGAAAADEPAPPVAAPPLTPATTSPAEAAEPPAPAAAEPAAPAAEKPDAPADEPTPRSELPAAPPAPELSSSDDKTDK